MVFLTILVITENYHLWPFSPTEISFYLISHLMHFENFHIQLRRDTASENTGFTSLRCLCMLAWSNYLLGAQRYEIMIRNDSAHHRTLHHPVPEVLRVAHTSSCLRTDRGGGAQTSRCDRAGYGIPRSQDPEPLMCKLEWQLHIIKENKSRGDQHIYDVILK